MARNAAALRSHGLHSMRRDMGTDRDPVSPKARRSTERLCAGAEPRGITKYLSLTNY